MSANNIRMDIVDAINDLRFEETSQLQCEVVKNLFLIKVIERVKPSCKPNGLSGADPGQTVTPRWK